jgi:hypothetical protein
VQKRIQDYGSPVAASSLKSMAASFSGAAILSGFDFAVESSDRIRVAPGAAVTNQGVIITESESKSITIPLSAPADYTIYYYHVDQNVSGGVAATLTLASGILPQENVDGVVLGYVRYPGGGVSLDTSFFVQPAVRSLGSSVPSLNSGKWVVPVNNNGYVVISTSGASLNFINAYEVITTGTSSQLFLKIQNNQASSGYATLLFPFKVSELPFALFEAIFSVDVNASLVCSFIDSQGSVFQLAPAYTGVPNSVLYRLSIPKTSIQNSSSIVYMKLECSVSAARSIRLQAIGLSEYNLYL